MAETSRPRLRSGFMRGSLALVVTLSAAMPAAVTLPTIAALTAATSAYAGDAAPVVLDAEWDRDYAGFRCNDSRCAGAAVHAAMNFETALLGQFASHPACRRVHVIVSDGSDHKASRAIMRAPHWELQISYSPKTNIQDWSLANIFPGIIGSYAGRDTPAAIAKNVCTIVQRKDATVAD